MLRGFASVPRNRTTFDMRLYVKKFALIIFGALATTLLVTVLNSMSNPSLTPDRHSPTKLGLSKEAIKRTSPELLHVENQQQRVEDIDPNVDNVKKAQAMDDMGQMDGKEKMHGKMGDEKKLVKEEPWAKDDQIVVPDESTQQIGTKRRVLDEEIVGLKEKLHLDEFRIIDECPNRTTLAEYYRTKYKKPWPNEDSWDAFYAQIGSCDMYRENSDVLQTILHDLTSLPIKSAVNMDGGTQIKLIFTFENGKRAVFKPMRFSRLYETDPNHFYFSDFERHHAEIAAFHLDKILGFRHAVPTVGRVMNISSELWAKADKTLARTFFYSPTRNLCFVGKCDYYCDTTHAICGKPDTKEGSVQMFLPDEEIMPREHNKSPYKRTYSKRNQDADWQKDATYCQWKVKYSPPFSNGRRLLDLVDLYILDFLMGNQDRHHYETIEVFEGFPPPFVHLDNGRAFGKPHFDDMSILAPFTQCCIIKPSTARTLLHYYTGPISLSEALRQSLFKDPVAPILAEKYLKAVDRRLEIVLRELGKCLKKLNGDYRKVVMANFYNPDAPAAGEDEDEDDE